MRFLLRYRYGIFQERTERIYVGSITSTDQLLEIVASKFKTTISDIVLRTKPNNLDYFKIIPGWNIVHYELKDGAEL